jgi:hypothetical protein
MDQSPQPKYIPEDKPCPYGNRFARMFQTWYGWLLFAIGLGITLIVFLMFINVINTAPLLLPLLLFFYWLLCLAALFFGIFYWGARFRDRQARVMSGECEPDKEVPADENKQRERLLNLGNSQWLLFYFIVAIFFVLLFLTIFLWTEGLETWQPLPVGPTNVEITNFILIKGFQIMTLGVFSAAFIIILYTGSDFVYRQFRSLNTWHSKTTGSGLTVDQSYAHSGINVLRDRVF